MMGVPVNTCKYSLPVNIPKSKDEATLSSLGWLNRKVVLTVGQLQAQKSQDMMIRAIPEILKHPPNFCMLWWVMENKKKNWSP
jgi:hypothetical protein